MTAYFEGALFGGPVACHCADPRFCVSSSFSVCYDLSTVLACAVCPPTRDLFFHGCCYKTSCPHRSFVANDSLLLVLADVNCSSSFGMLIQFVNCTSFFTALHASVIIHAIDILLFCLRPSSIHY